MSEAIVWLSDMHEKFPEKPNAAIQTEKYLIKVLSSIDYSKLSLHLQATIKVMSYYYTLKPRPINHGMYYHYLLEKYISKMI